MKSLLIKNGKIYDPDKSETVQADILVQEGVIKKIGSVSEMADEIIDAQGLSVCPGLVDVHVHFRDPGLTHKEDIYTGARAAAAGGYTSVVMMANTKPVIDNVDTLKYCINKGKETDIHVYSAAAITKGMAGKELNDMDELLEAGAAGFTDDGLPILDESIVKMAMVKGAELGVPLSFHEEDPAYIENNGVNRGVASEYYGIGGSPRDAEISMIDRDLKLAIETGAIIDIQHISTKEGVQLVREAKKKSDKIHAEAAPHHFTLTDEAVIKHGTLAKMNPPLRTEADRLAVIEAIKDGTIDIIATDHAPHSAEEKAQDITKAPSGIIGLETAFSLAVTKLVHEAGVPMLTVIKALTKGPADMYGLNCGHLREGGPADIMIFDENKVKTYNSFNSKATNTPFTGESFEGTVMYTICNGNIIYRV